MSSPEGSGRLDHPGLWNAAVEGRKEVELFADVGGVPTPSREGAAMVAAADGLLVVLRDETLDCLSPAVVPQEAGAHGCGRRREAEDQPNVVVRFGCLTKALYAFHIVPVLEEAVVRCGLYPGGRVVRRARVAAAQASAPCGRYSSVGVALDCACTPWKGRRIIWWNLVAVARPVGDCGRRCRLPSLVGGCDATLRSTFVE